MTATLAERYVAARRHGQDPVLAMWMDNLDASERRGIWLLSVVLSATPRDLSSAFDSVWPRAVAPDWETIARSPFVVSEASGLLLRDAEVTSQVRRAFENAGHDEYLTAHRAFAAVEERRAVDQREDGGDEEWFTRGRLAYYLAAEEPERALSTFDDAFSTPPTFDRTAARMWLTSLVLRQSDLLADHKRHLDFYEGFRAYVTERRERATAAFGRVVKHAEDDEITAIAEHLLGVLIKTESIEKSDALLGSSVRRSHRIGFTLNEIMAANSRVWTLVRRSNGSNKAKSLRTDAVKLAVANHTTALEFGQPALVLRCTLTMIVARWAGLTDGNTRVGTQALREADTLIRRLGELRVHAQEYGDPQTVASAVNQSALILRDLDRSDEALDQLEQLSNKGLRTTPLGHLIKLEKTARSICRRPMVGAPTVRRAGEIAEVFAAEQKRSRARPSDLDSDSEIESEPAE